MKTATEARAQMAAKIAQRTDAQLLEDLIVAEHMQMGTTEAGRMTIGAIIDALTDRLPAVLTALDAWELDMETGQSMAQATIQAARTALA